MSVKGNREVERTACKGEGEYFGLFAESYDEL